MLPNLQAVLSASKVQKSKVIWSRRASKTESNKTFCPRSIPKMHIGIDTIHSVKTLKPLQAVHPNAKWPSMFMGPSVICIQFPTIHKKKA